MTTVKRPIRNRYRFLGIAVLAALLMKGANYSRRIDRTLACVLAALIVLIVPAVTTVAVAEVTFMDREFAPGNWTTTAVLSQTPLEVFESSGRIAEFHVSHETSGGNSGPFTRMVNLMEGLDPILVFENPDPAGEASNQSWGFMFNEQAVYDPAVRGPVERINFIWDARYPTGFPLAGLEPIGGAEFFVGTGFADATLAVRQYDEMQDRELYWSVNSRSLQVNSTDHANTWTRFSILDILPQEFLALAAWREPGQPTQPDFSKPVTFGYVQTTRCNNQCRDDRATYASRVDIDNWQVVINPSEGIRFSQAEYGVREDAGEVTLTVWRIGDTSGPASVLLSTEDGTAGENEYEGLLDRLLSFAAGQDSLDTSITIKDTDIFRAESRFTARLHNTVDGVLGEPEEATVIIQDKSADPCLASFGSVNSDTGADLYIVGRCEGEEYSPFETVVPDGDFLGLTAGFNELRYRNSIRVSVVNRGPDRVRKFTLEIRIPKEHLAGYGLENAGLSLTHAGDPPDPRHKKGSVECNILIEDNPQFVVVRCEKTYDEGSELLPYAIDTVFLVDRHTLYVGYAATVPAGRQFVYEAQIVESSPADPDDSNNFASFIHVPNPAGSGSGSGGSGGALSPWLLAVLALWGLAVAVGRAREEKWGH